jgi:hypothetical protein
VEQGLNKSDKEGGVLHGHNTIIYNNLEEILFFCIPCGQIILDTDEERGDYIS